MGKKKNRQIAVLFAVLLLFITWASGCDNGKHNSWSPGKPFNKDALKIGVVYLDDAASGYSYAHDLGIKKTQTQFALRDDQIIRKYNANDAVVSEHMMREAIAEGSNVIIATSWIHMDSCEKLALEYPNVIFTNATGNKNNDRNFTNYFGRIYQARYLSGVAAGLKTKTNKIGFVAAMDKSNSEVTGGLDAFALGVESVNPGAEIYARVTYSWFDPSGERQAARQLLDEGCDVIAQHCDTPMPQIEAEEAGAWGIGYNSDMSREAPNAVLTSVVWDWSVYYTFLVGGIIDGSFSTEPYYGNMEDGLVDIMPLNGALATPDITDAVAYAKSRILSGECNVFDGAMETNDGSVVGAEGSTLSDSEIVSGIDWYYHNIIVMK